MKSFLPCVPALALVACCLGSANDQATSAGTAGPPASRSSTGGSTSGGGSTSAGAGGDGSGSSGGVGTGSAPFTCASQPPTEPQDLEPWSCSCAEAGSCEVTVALTACGSAPQFNDWEILGYQVNTPPGSDVALFATAIDSLDAGTGPSTLLCPSLQYGGCGDPIDLRPLALQGSYLVITARLSCASDGGAPALECVTATAYCADS